MSTYREIKAHFDSKVVPQCAKICQAMKVLSEAGAYDELKRVRTLAEQEVLIPLKSLLDSVTGRDEKQLALRKSIDELITYLSDKISSLDPDNINPDDLAKAKATWAWLDTTP